MDSLILDSWIVDSLLLVLSLLIVRSKSTDIWIMESHIIVILIVISSCVRASIVR